VQIHVELKSQVDLRTRDYRPLVRNLTSAIAVDFHYAQRTLVWTDVAQEKIFMCNMSNETSPTDPKSFGLLTTINDTVKCRSELASAPDVVTPDGIAVDWVCGRFL
jgi:hypothetical protein